MIHITNAEKQIICLLHLSNKEIANRLFITLSTVKTHVHNLLVKFEAKNRLDLLMKVIQDRSNQKMLSVKDINMLNEQNECLRKQNQALQNVFLQVLKICQEPADNMAVVDLQNRIKEVLDNEQSNR